VVLAADDGVHGNELWFSDGTEAGTALIQEINPLTTCDSDGNPGEGSDPCGSWAGPMTELNGTLYFQADDGSHGLELWALESDASVYTVCLPLVQRL
jgi:ELWxxDGT repeat protein